MIWLSWALAGKVTVPVDVGVGPAAYTLTGPVAQDQLLHSGLSLSVYAVLDKKALRKHRKKIPKEYRQAVKQMDEVRISPSIWIPDHIILSPPVNGTGLYGVTWEPFTVGVPLGRYLDADLGLVATAAWLHSDSLPNTLFLRPGVSASLEWEFPLSKQYLVSFGWDSKVYVPQELGSLAIAQDLDSIWHIGHGFVELHVRFPYTVRL